jgi:signal transduction histidine kinase
MNFRLLNIWKAARGTGKLSYNFRLVAYTSAIILIIVHHLENNFPFGILEYLTIVIFILTPQYVLYRYVKSGNNVGQVIKDITIDFFFAGWFIGVMNLCVVPSVVFGVGAVTNYIAGRGLNKLYRMFLMPLGCLIILSVEGYQIHLDSSPWILYLSVTYGVFHYIINAYVLYNSINIVRSQNNEIEQQRIEIQEKSEELRALNESLRELNANLEQIVFNRTQELEIKNKKLEEYTFINAHKLRAPVATILGLIQLLDYKNLMENEKILDQLKKTATDLDTTTKDIRAKLEAEGWLPRPE